MVRVKLGKGFVSDSGVVDIGLPCDLLLLRLNIWLDGVLSKAGLVWFLAVLISSFMLESRLIQLNSICDISNINYILVLLELVPALSKINLIEIYSIEYGVHVLNPNGI